MLVSVPAVLRMAVVTAVSFALAAGSAVAVVRLVVRTRFFSVPERLPNTWHGRPLHRADSEPHDGLNPFLLGFVTFWVVFGVALIALDGPSPT
ncbi:hypothetical protein [Halosimplex sp. J119]